MKEYLLWHTTLGGWFSNMAGYTTRFENAKLFTRDEALAVAKRHLTDGEFGVILVSHSDMEEVRG